MQRIMRRETLAKAELTRSHGVTTARLLSEALASQRAEVARLSAKLRAQERRAKASRLAAAAASRERGKALERSRLKVAAAVGLIPPLPVIPEKPPNADSGEGGGGGGDDGFQPDFDGVDDASLLDDDDADGGGGVGGVARAVSSPALLVRTRLLEGRVTCSVLRAGGLVDATVREWQNRRALLSKRARSGLMLEEMETQGAHDILACALPLISVFYSPRCVPDLLLLSKGRLYPGRWEGFWCHVISPVYFGRKSGGRVAGTIAPAPKKGGAKGGGKGARTLVSFGSRDGGGDSSGSVASGLSGATAAEAAAWTSGTGPYKPPRPIKWSGPRDPYTKERMVPDPRVGAAPGALVPESSLKKKRHARPPNRPVDPAALARDADAALELLTKGGKAVSLGIDGKPHLTPAQWAATRHAERAHLNLRQFDARRRRKAEASGEVAASARPWYSRPRRPLRRLTAAEVDAMVAGDDAEALRARRARNKAAVAAKAKRKAEGEIKRRRAAIEAWLQKALMDLNPTPDLFSEAMEAEANREKVKGRGESWGCRGCLTSDLCAC